MNAGARLDDWIGHEQSCTDNMDAGHASRVALALDRPAPDAGAELPPLWHWAFFIMSGRYAELGSDGHLHRGGFLPPADNRNRMWAGGRVEFLHPLKVGQPATRTSTIKNVVEKRGRTGRLLFATVRHTYDQAGAACIIEEQDIVYREPSPPKLTGTEQAPTAQWSQTIRPTSIMLFRYSAVTFNGHRIHYDFPYARDVEGYPGLVVHGPLIATLMVEAFVQEHPGKTVQKLTYRGLRPLIAPEPFKVAGTIESAGTARIWAEQAGTLAHWGEIQYKDRPHDR